MSSRFAFGENWSRFISSIDEERVDRAIASLRELLGCERLDGETFLDIGSGSGLSSLAARRIGARVVSFDYDPTSVTSTQALREKYYPRDTDWSIRQGSVLDREFMKSLGQFDVVYSWGVLRHTANLWAAMEAAAEAVRPGGKFAVAIYNDQGRTSRIWAAVKRLYNALPRPLRSLVLVPAAIWLWAPALIRDFLLLRPFATWRNYSRNRGMSPWRDVVDWVGGYPFEVAKPEEIFEFCRPRGFVLTKLKTCAGGLGCNEFTFERSVSDIAHANRTARTENA